VTANIETLFEVDEEAAEAPRIGLGFEEDY
jgi:hypothetical protein